MSPEIRNGLRGLCLGNGWTYGAYWRFDQLDPRLLVLEDSFYEENIGAEIDKIISHVHVAGEGTTGAAAMYGKHQWIYSDACGVESNPSRANGNVEIFNGIDEWQGQFLAGMKTIVTIPLPSFGVVQFGSTQKNYEDLEFIYHVQQLFHLLPTMNGELHLEDSCSAVKICDTNHAFTSGISSFRDNSLQVVISKELQADVKSSLNASSCPSLFPLGSLNDTGYYSGSTNSHPLATAAIGSTGASNCFGNPFQKLPSIRNVSSFHATSQYGTSNADPYLSLLTHNNKQFSHYYSGNPFAANYSENNCAKVISKLSMPGQRLLPGMTSHANAPHLNSIHRPYGGSKLACSASRSPGVIYGSGKVLDLQHSSSSSSSSAPLYADGLSTSKSSSISTSFAPELLDNFLTILPDVAPFKDDPIHPCLPPTEQMIEGPPIEDNLVTVQSEAIDCSHSNSLLTMPDERFTMEAVNSSLEGDRKLCSATVPTQLLLDNDLFEGMELDLSPKVLREDCWDDLIMPLGNGNCSNLSTSVSDGISDIPVADKGLFSESSFEQLLEAVVGGTANLSSIQNSGPISTNSVDHLDLEHQLSAMARVDYPQTCRDRTPVPEFNLEKMMQKMPSKEEKYNFVKGEAYSKSHVSSWIDDNCSINAESAVTNQPKKSEETAKIARKRARPGESTRPRPKDRQQIQDRVKELRDIVPNGSKCSIDSLLDRTIKHMLFLQSVTKYADKLKHSDEPKLIGDKSGVILKDNSGGGSSGATWAYEVAGQTMVCPILVEDLNPPGQMLVEMLCEEHGFFLEIADIIRGFGLTILKGVMEIRSNKIWARFLVEANKDVTRMDIFLSLVQLSQQTSSIRSHEPRNKAIDKGIPTKFTNYQQSPVSVSIDLPDASQ